MSTEASSVIHAVELAGQLTADSLARISESNVCEAVLAHPGSSGPMAIRIIGDNPVELGAARARLNSLASTHGSAALLFVSASNPGQKSAYALVIHLAVPAENIRITIPIRHPREPGGLGVWSPEFSTDSATAHDLPQLGEAFFRGIAAYPGGRALWDRHHRTADGRKTVDSLDLGELALSLVVRSTVYFAAAAVLAAIVMIVLSLFGPSPLSRLSGWPIVWGIWGLLQLEVLNRVRRRARSAPPYRATSRTLHGLELSAACFLLLYSFARPHLADNDASAYRYVEHLFQYLVGCTAFYHATVLYLFGRRPGAMDAWALGAAITVALVSLLRQP